MNRPRPCRTAKACLPRILSPAECRFRRLHSMHGRSSQQRQQHGPSPPKRSKEGCKTRWHDASPAPLELLCRACTTTETVPCRLPLPASTRSTALERRNFKPCLPFGQSSRHQNGWGCRLAKMQTRTARPSGRPRPQRLSKSGAGRGARYARGRRMIKSLPLPTSLCTSISPCMEMTMCLTMARPSPVPPMARERPLSTR